MSTPRRPLANLKVRRGQIQSNRLFARRLRCSGRADAFRRIRVHARRRRAGRLSHSECGNSCRIQPSGRLNALIRLELSDRGLRTRPHDSVDGSCVIALIVQCLLRRTHRGLVAGRRVPCCRPRCTRCPHVRRVRVVGGGALLRAGHVLRRRARAGAGDSSPRVHVGRHSAGGPGVRGATARYAPRVRVGARRIRRTRLRAEGKFDPVAYLLEDFVAPAALTRSGAFEFMPVVAEPEG